MSNHAPPELQRQTLAMTKDFPITRLGWRPSAVCGSGRGY
jgi:hypothetical protein